MPEPALGSTFRVVIVGALVWASVWIFAVVCFVSVVISDRSGLSQDEVLSYASAVAVASAIAGVMTIAIHGKVREALKIGISIALCFAMCLVAGGTVTTIYGYQHPSNILVMGPKPYLRQDICYLTRNLVDCVVIGGTLGSILGVALGCLAGVVGVLIRRRVVWTIAAGIGVVSLVSSGWGIKHTISWATETVTSGQWFGWGKNEEILGAAVGAALGAVAGGLIGVFVARSRPTEGKSSQPPVAAAAAG